MKNLIDLFKDNIYIKKSINGIFYNKIKNFNIFFEKFNKIFQNQTIQSQYVNQKK